jgi:hypothetical protein
MALILIGHILILKLILFHFDSENIIYPSRINQDLKYHVPVTVHKSFKETKRENMLCSSFLKKFVFIAMYSWPSSKVCCARS